MDAHIPRLSSSNPAFPKPALGMEGLGSLGTDVTGQPSHVRQLPCLPVGPVAFGKMINAL